MIVKLSELCCVCLGAGGQDPIPDGLCPGFTAFCPQHEGHQGQWPLSLLSYWCILTQTFTSNVLHVSLVDVEGTQLGFIPWKLIELV